MDRERAFPSFDDAWVVHRDASLIVVDKPPFMPFQAVDATRDDDLVGRLRRHLGRAGEPNYLGIHQRLDKDTSGLVLFVREKSANARVAAQFESRSVNKTYVACVTGWPRGRERATLRDELTAGENGKIIVVPHGVRGAKLAVTHVREIGRHGERAMLELVLDTGRTHQARVQLARAGAPIAGDVIYGGARAPRLMLHAQALALERPGGGMLSLHSAPPADLVDWLERGDLGAAIFDDEVALRRALALAAAKRFALAHAPKTTCFRLVHEDGDALPALAVDVYGDYFVVHLRPEGDSWNAPGRRERVLDALGALGPDGIYLKLHPKHANVLAGTRREDIAPALPVRGACASDPLVAHEDGLELLVRLGDGLSTGLFLDQRANRARVRAASSGRRVLNLFSYTCAFTVAAVAGGAVGSTSVDASAAALERGRENLLRARADLVRHVLVADDTFAYLARAARKNERFDLVVLDPPSYSTVGSRRFVADADYGDLAAAALAVLSPGGALVACTNHRKLSLGRFRKMLRRAAQGAKRVVAQLKDLAPGADFPTPVGAEPTMKSVWLRVGA